MNGVINTQYKNQIIPDLALLDENISSSLTSALSNKAHPIHEMYSQYKDTRQHLYVQILANKPIEDLQVTQRLQLAELAALVLSPEFFNLVEDVSMFVQHTLPMLGQTIIILLEEDECFLKT